MSSQTEQRKISTAKICKILEDLSSDFAFGDHVDFLFAGKYTASYASVRFDVFPPSIEYYLRGPRPKDLAGHTDTGRVSTAILQ